MCDKFVFLQNTERKNERFLRYDRIDPPEKHMAGIHLLMAAFDEITHVHNFGLEQYHGEFVPVFFNAMPGD